MGLNAKSLHYLHELFMVQNITFPTNLKMLELGNILLEQKGFINQIIGKYGKPDKTAKGYFESLGFEHTSIDINGAHGSLQLDLREPFPKEFYNKFNVLTNFGTTEHIIDNQYQVFKNFYDAAAPGALMVHQVPFTTFGHAYWAYRESFFENLAINCKCRIIDLRIGWLQYRHPGPWYDPIRKKRYIYVGLVKETDMKFMSEKQWNTQKPLFDGKGYMKCGKEQYDNWIEDNRKGK